MYDRGRSGQFLYFNLLGSTSGLPITGIASGLISGRRCLDGGAITVCSGPIIEDGGGMYHLNMYAEDVAGNNIGFIFSTSGGINVAFTAITQQNVSGKLFLGSGSPVLVYSGQLSGQPVSPSSGAFTVASLNSGQPVLVYSGQLSGQPLTATVGSGLSVIASLYSGQVTAPYSGSLSGQVVTAASGVFGIASLNSGQFAIPYSGSLSGQKVELFSGNVVVPLSGAFVQASLNSGQPVLVYSGQLSGQQVTARTVTDKSGYTADLISGVNFVASGHSTVSTLYSGQEVVVASGQLSGQPISATVGSGLFVNASLNSGQQVLVYSGQLSGQPVSPNSGAFVQASLLSGQRALPYSGQLSGQSVLPGSGTTFLGSGQVSVQIPQSVLSYDFSGSPDSSGVRNLLNANRKLINRWSLNVASGYLRVYQEDDSTTAYDQAVTSTSGAPPITSLDT